MTFSVTILGSSSALPTSKRFSTAQVLNVHERFFLIDCGEGVQIQLRKFRIKFGKINHIFISHLHGDHFFGLFGLLSSFHLLGRETDLNIYSHPELEEILKNLSWFFDELKFKIIFHPLNYETSEVIYSGKYVEVKSFPLKHRIPTCGFLFKEKPKQRNIRKEYVDRYNIPIKDIVKIKQGADFVTDKGITIPNKELTIPPPVPRSYAFCSDTAFDERIIPEIQNVDLLYHESTYLQDLKKQAAETFHSTASQAAAIAQKANAGKLIIGHFSSRYKEVQSFLDEAQLVFPNTFVAEDGETHDVEICKAEM